MNTEKGYADDAGVDILVDIQRHIYPSQYFMIDTGFSHKLKKGQLGMIVPRSSMAKKGLMISTCVVDPGYEGNWHVGVFNASPHTITLNKGESFCSAIVVSSHPIPCNNIKKKGKRGTNKFGSTNK